MPQSLQLLVSWRSLHNHNTQSSYNESTWMIIATSIRVHTAPCQRDDRCAIIQSFQIRHSRDGGFFQYQASTKASSFGALLWLSDSMHSRHAKQHAAALRCTFAASAWACTPPCCLYQPCHILFSGFLLHMAARWLLIEQREPP